MSFDFIFMLTENDKTIPDARERIKEVIDGGAIHIGFKDVGLPFEELQLLAEDIRQAGAFVYLEVVSLDQESEIRSAKAAMTLNVDYLLGGTRPELVAPLVRNHPLKYYPFAGEIEGHPSILSGSVASIAQHAGDISAIDGVDGLDLLAYRFAGDVPELMRRVCEASSKSVIMAGSIDNQERIEAVYQSGASGFTVGTAAFAGAFPSEKPGLQSQVSAISKKCLEVQQSPRPTG
ncbi:4-hydroxythreonine-4-phosphate dehydrogenase [Grimontia kaedaensis]|uniref:4-hydroxythreonine-4-phosphate dehydrogenase n=1 Tax=Grimontia kaedaensis TaxID=2872157 RepID=A0ABY4WZJ9_9GAMM|nr:4-hydroxythreonine-4-phosphate dehydrogenase [Grimontia kaedaensis]USH04410.1 4-hydroxythreonine-4-phosphate dehydrogenase [Grimontia kaedaensis]